MIRIAMVVGAVILTQGCAQMQQSLTLATMSTTERAKYDCAQFGWRMGTPEHSRCVQDAVIGQRMADTMRPRTTTVYCERWMNGVQCR